MSASCRETIAFKVKTFWQTVGCRNPS